MAEWDQAFDWLRGRKKIVFLANGEEIPDACVQALEDLERRWPGATLPQARGAIVSVVLKAYHKKNLDVPET